MDNRESIQQLGEVELRKRPLHLATILCICGCALGGITMNIALGLFVVLIAAGIALTSTYRDYFRHLKNVERQNNQ